MRKIVKTSFDGKKKLWRKWANGLTIYDSENNWSPGAGLSPLWGNITIIFKDLKRLGHSRPISMIKYLYRKVGGVNVLMNNPGHMANMADMPIYGKNLSKTRVLQCEHKL